MAVLSSDLIRQGASGASTGYTIDQSIRFNPGDSTYMQRTHGAGGNVDLFTVSFWFKRCNLGSIQMLFNSGANISNVGDIFFTSSDTLEFRQYIGTYQTRLITTQVFRDVSAWYHCVVVYDSGNAVSTERARMYINGQRVSSFGTETYPSQNQDGIIGSNVNIGFGWYVGYQSGSHFDGYLAELHYVNGYAYGPEYFGEFDSSDNWIPKEYTGSYGTGGFFVDGRDSSDLGDDESGQGNDLSTSGLAAHDQVLDTPNNNFATYNSIYNDYSGLTSITHANGNLQATGTSGQFDHTTLTHNLPKSGKWYFEYYLGGLYTGMGICIIGQEGSITGGYGFGNLSTSQGFGYQNNSIYNGSGQTTDFGLGNRSAGDIMSAAFDIDNDKVYIGINNTYIAADGGNDGNPSSGANPTVTTSFSLSTNDIIIGFYLSSSSSATYLNCGQEGTFGGNKTAGGNSDANGIGNFLYAVPTNYLAFCSQNLFSSGG